MNFQPTLKSKAEYQNINRAQIVSALAVLRKEWQETVNEGSLLEVASSVGLPLADITNILELSTQERRMVLGAKLQREVDAYERTNIRKRKLPL